MDTNSILALSAAATAIATGFIGYFSWRTIELAQSNTAIANSNLEVAKQIAWFSGAVESHSELQLKLEAKRFAAEGVEMIWWDPTLEAVPGLPKHKERVDVSTIYFFLPKELRAKQDKVPRG